MLVDLLSNAGDENVAGRWSGEQACATSAAKQRLPLEYEVAVQETKSFQTFFTATRLIILVGSKRARHVVQVLYGRRKLRALNAPKISFNISSQSNCVSVFSCKLKIPCFSTYAMAYVAFLAFGYSKLASVRHQYEFCVGFLAHPHSNNNSASYARSTRLPLQVASHNTKMVVSPSDHKVDPYPEMTVLKISSLYKFKRSDIGEV